MKKMIQQVNHYRTSDDFNAMNIVKSFLKDFNVMIMDTITKKSSKKVYSEIVPHKEESRHQAGKNEKIVQAIVNSAKTLEREGFADMQNLDVLELLLAISMEEPFSML